MINLPKIKNRDFEKKFKETILGNINKLFFLTLKIFTTRQPIEITSKSYQPNKSIIDIIKQSINTSNNFTKKKRIVILDSQPKPIFGGGQVVANNLFKYLSKYFDVTFVADKVPYDPYYSYAIPSFSGFRKIAIRFYNLVKFYRKFNKEHNEPNNSERIEKGMPNIQYLLLTGLPNFIVKLLVNKNAIKYIEEADVIISNSVFDPFILRVANIKRKNIIKINHLSINFESIKKNNIYLRNLCYKKGSSLVSVVLTSSQVKLSESLGIKTIWIPNGIEIAAVTNEIITETLNKYNLSEKKYILSIGRLVDSLKGFSLVIKTMSILKDKNYIYIIAGDGPDKNKYINLIKSLGLKDKVKLIGPVYGNEKMALIKSSFAFIQPSYFETFSLVTLEALSQGAIVLVSKNEGSIDIIKDGENGFFIELDENDIKNKIEMIEKMDEREKEKIKINALKTASAYSIENMISKYIQLIHSL